METRKSRRAGDAGPARTSQALRANGGRRGRTWAACVLLALSSACSVGASEEKTAESESSLATTTRWSVRMPGPNRRQSAEIFDSAR